ncbi:LOW QUALITY PROTEIN: hypothetical protein T265_15241, partial [Opisthorchis viverrini]
TQLNLVCEERPAASGGSLWPLRYTTLQSIFNFYRQLLVLDSSTPDLLQLFHLKISSAWVTTFAAELQTQCIQIFRFGDQKRVLLHSLDGEARDIVRDEQTLNDRVT